MKIYYIFFIIFGISIWVSSFAWYRLRMEYLERNKLSEWHYYAFGRRAYRETMKGSSALVKRCVFGFVIALVSFAIGLICHIFGANQ